jgi:hypothetical protein
MKTPRLIASAKPGVHEVKIFNCYIKKSGYVKPTHMYRVSKFKYARVRKAIFEEQPTEKAFISAVLTIAHKTLRANLEQFNLENT